MAAAIDAMMKVESLGLRETSRLLPLEQCRGIIEAIDKRRTMKLTEAEAASAGKLLLGMYPARQVHDSDTFSKALTSLFQHYDMDHVRRAVDPVAGLPSRLKYLPTIAEVKEALDAEVARRFKIRATAAWMVGEHERRRLEEEERRKWDLTPEQLEARRKQVEELLQPQKMETERE